jgi:hexosaminidase
MSATLTAAFKRFTALLYPASSKSRCRSGTEVEPAPISGVTDDTSSSGIMTGCAINVTTNTMNLGLQTDESYTLTIGSSSDTCCTIKAATVYGAMYAMETLVQLINRTGPAMTVVAARVIDQPRFALRATMIDTARHFLPVSTILNHLDSMAAVKMNALHWHMVDSQSFPFVSKIYPELSAHGAFHPDEVYTYQDVERVVRTRVPAHTHSRQVKFPACPVHFCLQGRCLPGWFLFSLRQ